MLKRLTDSTHVTVRTASGDCLDMLCGFTYNAAINAFELRAPKLEQPENTIPDLSNASPLYVTEMGRIRMLVHFETAQRVPITINDHRVTFDDSTGRPRAHDLLVTELMILRSVRIEVVD